MSLSRFWPTEANCLECINPEAESPSDGIFLAVHQEMRFIRKSFHSDLAEGKSQKQLLNEFLKDEPSGSVILPILGESGIGKSHLVRWLKIQLQLQEDHKRRHVILIPKTASLKTVLGRILHGLKGSQYVEIGNKLKAAREQMDSIGAKQRIRGELLAAIERNYSEASERQKKAKLEGKKLDKQDRLWIGHGDPRSLPSLLMDPATECLFTKGTANRPGIITEFARHLNKKPDEKAARLLFEPEDFVVPPELADVVTDAGPIARRYLEKLQRTTSTEQLDDAVTLLNGLVDSAIGPLATPPDTSLSELFFAIRKQMLKDGLELVLLVEDFAVLAGVQKALLDVITSPGSVGGKVEACTIRTALAVTDGYFMSANLETVKTRAKHGWWIESGENETEEAVTNQIGNFVAAYVNAARVGAAQLEKHYSTTSNINKIAPNAMEFLSPESEDLSLLASFGESVDGYSLFPFNQSAICAIADHRLRNQQGDLKFHPRSVINEIILPVVKDARINFERSAFPPENFLGFPKTRISTDLNTEVARKESDPIRREQYLYLLHFWAAQPQLLSEVKLPSGVYEAFGLSVLDGSETTVAPKPLVPLTKTGAATDPLVEKPEVDEPAIEREPTPIRQFVEKLDAWKGGGTLGQTDANRIRGWINSHLLYSINWEAELLRPLKPATDTYANRIYLPRAGGNKVTAEQAFIAVAADDDFENDEVANPIFLAIRAMLRYHHYSGWNYAQAEDDYIAIANFVDVHLPKATQWIHRKYKKVDGSPVPAITEALLWQARQLNVETAHKTDDASHIDAIFAESPERRHTDDDEEWNEFLGEIVSNRKQLQEELLHRVGAFQGATGGKAFAVDASQLLDVVKEFRKTWNVTQKFPKMPTTVPNELKAISRHITLLMRYGVARVESRRVRISNQSKLIVIELGKDYDKNALLKDLDEVCSLSEQHGLKGEVTAGQVRKLAERFKDSRAKEVSEQVEAIVSGDEPSDRMTAIARLDIETHALLVEFSATCSKFLRERAGKAQGQILTWTPEVVETKKADVDAILKELEDAVAPYGKVDE